MIAPEVVDRIRRMLDQGELSQRGIARRLGVSRGTVNAIALARRPDYEAQWRREADEIPAPSGPPRRCPECGAMVLMPCVACGVRAIQDRRRRERRRRAAGNGRSRARDALHRAPGLSPLTSSSPSPPSSP